jgi:hypothetical protein
MAERRRRPGQSGASGRLALVWGDPPSGPALIRYVVVDEADPRRRTEIRLRPSRGRDAGGLLALNGRRVSVRRAGGRARVERAPGPIVDAAITATSLVAAAIAGPTPWLNVLCKYADIADEPVPPSYVRRMFGTAYPGLAQYWAEVSYGRIGLEGSRTLGWRRLPGSEAEYMDGDGNPNLGLLFDHAVALIADVPVGPYYGLNLFVNGGVGCCNWGTRWWATVGGITREWGITWLPLSALRYIRVVAHEMGHGYGLPHSTEDTWDVMSIGTCGLPSAIHHPRFGCVDAHTIAFHKDQLGWVPPERKHLHGGGARTIALEQLALPRTSDYLLAQAPIGDSTTRFYTVETRRRAGYDAPVRGDAVVIHEVDLTRAEPARPVRNPARDDDMWLPIAGQDTFVDAEAGVRVTVAAPSPSGSGFVVLIVARPAIPAAPSNLRLGAVTATSIEVVWDDNSADETAFEVWWLPEGEPDWRIETLAADVTSWTQTGLAPGSRITYYVRACNAEGCSDWSNGIAATTAAPPAAPSDLRVAGATARSVALEWRDNSADETEFQVWWLPIGGTGWTAVTLAAGVTRWTHEGTTPQTEYIYYVRACNDAGCSDWSNAAVAVTPALQPPAPPSDLRVVAVTASSIELAWQDNAEDETHSQVWRTPAGGTDWTIVPVGADVTRWTHGGLGPGMSFDYWVQACNEAGCSDFSDGVRATTLSAVMALDTDRPPAMPAPPAGAGRRPSRPAGTGPPQRASGPTPTPAGRPPPVDAPTGYGRPRRRGAGG